MKAQTIIGLLARLFLLTSIAHADRRKKELRCSRIETLDLDQTRDLREMPGRDDIQPNQLSGSFYDYEENYQEQYKGFTRGSNDTEESVATVNHNERIDIVEGKLDPRVLAQEGRSFCISGEHFKNIPELMNHLNFGGMQALAMRNFDIGSHVNPTDYSLMNIFPWPDYDIAGKLKPSLKGHLTKRADNRDPIYKWEDTDPVFFHSRVTKKPLPDNDGNVERPPIHRGFKFRPAVLEDQPDEDCRNPYFIEVTEIEANGVRLHNWLHITVYVKRENIIQKMNCATGRMTHIMLEVRDALGLPVGDFNAEADCGHSCKCKSANCRMIKDAHKNGMPCMMTPLRAVTQPGIFLYSKPAHLDYFDEVHVNWHFSQQTSYFVSELHFAALIVEKADPIGYYNGRQTLYENPLYCKKYNSNPFGITRAPGQALDNFKHQFKMHWIYTEEPIQDIISKDGQTGSTAADTLTSNEFASQSSGRPKGYYAFTLQHISDKTRPYGWTAQYRSLKPTIKTLGAWDIFRKKYVQPSLMNCHKRVDSAYFQEATTSKSILPYRKKMFHWNSNYSVHRYTEAFGEDKIYKKSIAIDRASADSSDYVTNYSMLPSHMFSGNLKKPDETFIVPRLYHGTLFTRFEYTNAEYERTLPKDIRAEMNRRQTLDDLIEQERCACPGVSQDEDNLSSNQMQGWRNHATYMLLAWVVFVPIGLFCIRFYKETYSRVFFLQEFWWYSVHVLCMVTAWIFMLGGIYAIEIKRLWDEDYELSDAALVHIILGSIAIILFTIQLFIAPFRLWKVEWRIIQIILHFTVGMLEYVLAAAAIIITSVIPQGRMSCYGFGVYIGFIFTQIIVYVIMEIHMRYVDKIIDLHPPRSYLPSPVVRLFFTNAPMSRLRVYILIVYVILCFVFFIILQRIVATHIASCFKDLDNDYEEEEF